MSSTHLLSYPLRLSHLERLKLQLMLAALKVSEYTDDVDDFRRPQNADRRAVLALREFIDVVTGLAIASDAVPRSLKETLLSADSHASAIASLLGDMCEIVRRHKRLNPASHHGEYGKLVMMLQDVQRRSVRAALGLPANLIVPIQTVGSALVRLECEQLVSDGALLKAYMRSSGMMKQEALNVLLNKYDKRDAERRDEIERVLRSIDDVHQLLHVNTEPLLYLRRALEQEFRSPSTDEAHNLRIQHGHSGACFSHSHATHVQYVAESLLLWEKVQRAIFDMWSAAEDDMLIDGGGYYEFCNTGQGYHRMCRAPKSYAIMSRCVREAEEEMGGWVGIKVIHLGDRDVPNPLVFIDKYTLIPRIIQPIVQTIRVLQSLFGEDGDATMDGSILHPQQEQEQEQKAHQQHRVQSHAVTAQVMSPCIHDAYPGLSEFLRHKYHSYAHLRACILGDFYRHAFDGSGDDGGSCIDGRLTSAWNWCHQLHKKTYCDAFVLTGFTGFD